MTSPFLHATLGGTNAAIQWAVRDNSYQESEGKVGKENVTAVDLAGKISEFGFHGNTSFFGLDAPHHTPTQDAKQDAKLRAKIGQPVNSR